MAGKRINKLYIFKTLRFSPELMEDIERILYFTQEGNKPKYPSLTNLIITAINELLRKERKQIEAEGVVWEHLKPSIER